ncbi:hypothetical protein EJB05_31740, partial [Eragrostis curvula]
MSLQRVRPFLLDLWDPFDNMFRSIVPSASSDSDTAAFANARIDWKETPEAHVFKADLPGVKKEEVKVEVEDGNVLVISGERSKEKEDKNDKWHRVERSSGQFMRRFRLPENAKVDQVKAGLENGVLTVTVPKAEVKKPEVKAIEISSIEKNAQSKASSLINPTQLNSSIRARKTQGNNVAREAQRVRPLCRLLGPFDGVFRSLVPAAASSDRDTAAFANARIDWKETPEAHVFKADLPGVKKEEVKVEVEEGNVLVISGESSKEKEDKNDKWRRVERSSGKFMRRFRLPENAKGDQVKAGLENGVLTVTCAQGRGEEA